MDPDNKIPEYVSTVIRNRRTAKILAKSSKAVTFSESTIRECDLIVGEAISDAGFAPFHYDRNHNGVAEPWRFHLIGNDDCRHISKHLEFWFPDMKPNNKLPAMLAACGCLVLVTWIPQFGASPGEEKQIQVDEEHLAAASAAVQNLLLILTAQNMKTYWSSGGFFRTPHMFDRLSIPPEEKLIGAIFVDYGANDDAEIISGKQHENRSDPSKWFRIATLDRS